MLNKLLHKYIKDQRGSMSTAVAFALCVVFFITFVVGCIEYFQPLQKNAQFKAACRDTLYKMELAGFLDVSANSALNSTLAGMGLVSITGGTNDFVSNLTTTTCVKQGADVRLYVQAKYTYSKLFFLSRSDRTETFTYDRTMVRRSITN